MVLLLRSLLGPASSIICGENAEYSSERLVTMYEPTRSHTQQGCNFHIRGSWNLKSHKCNGCLHSYC
jgi:hypothetical protein